ncbi:alpha/beta-hydrolase [Peniophora sp. CONT]|nr:alpha/beta-hydrolase [Peniophora sp. CONT]
MSFCEHCVQSVRHEGTPEGKYEEFNGIKTYVATPTKDFPKDKAVIYICDIFGLELPNNLLLADDYARNGFQTYAPDLFEGEPAPADHKNPDGSEWNIMEWFPRHAASHTVKRVQAVIDALKEKGVKEFAAVGYCYGARLVFDLAFAGQLKVAAGSHPSLLELSDFDRYAKEVNIPLLLNSCETDPQFPKEKQEHADKVFADFKAGWSRPYFPGATHGFAVRGDLSDPRVKAAKEGAFKNTVEWFIKYL